MDEPADRVWPDGSIVPPEAKEMFLRVAAHMRARFGIEPEYDSEGWPENLVVELDDRIEWMREEIRMLRELTCGGTSDEQEV